MLKPPKNVNRRPKREEKRNKIRITITLDPEVAYGLRDLCANRGVDRCKLANFIIGQYVRSQKSIILLDAQRNHEERAVLEHRAKMYGAKLKASEMVEEAVDHGYGGDSDGS